MRGERGALGVEARMVHAKRRVRGERVVQEARMAQEERVVLGEPVAQEERVVLLGVGCAGGAGGAPGSGLRRRSGW